jgi:hypothetical protein
VHVCGFIIRIDVTGPFDFDDEVVARMMNLQLVVLLQQRMYSSFSDLRTLYDSPLSITKAAIALLAVGRSTNIWPTAQEVDVLIMVVAAVI